MALYQICLFGQLDTRFDAFRQRLEAACVELGIEPNTIEFFNEADVGSRDARLPTVGIFFGYAGATDPRHPALAAMLADSATILPVVSNLQNAVAELPSLLVGINALEFQDPLKAQERLSSLVLESFRLLRRDRRLFISYKRKDSQCLADKLYQEFDKRGFDIFIDTRSVPPGVDFQAELWHRLADADVVVLIDTPNFRDSRWTTEELANANATNLQILHLLWPGQEPDADSAFSEFIELSTRDFDGSPSASLGGNIKSEVVSAICDAAERLRARAMKFRYRYLVDSFCDLSRDCGLQPAVQPDRWISVQLPNGGRLAVVPAIGVPTSPRINEVFEAITSTLSNPCAIWLLYDNRGLLDSWMRHLDWLDMHLPVRNIRAARAGDELARLLAC